MDCGSLCAPTQATHVRCGLHHELAGLGPPPILCIVCLSLSAGALHLPAFLAPFNSDVTVTVTTICSLNLCSLCILMQHAVHHESPSWPYPPVSPVGGGRGGSTNAQWKKTLNPKNIFELIQTLNSTQAQRGIVTTQPPEVPSIDRSIAALEGPPLILPPARGP